MADLIDDRSNSIRVFFHFVTGQRKMFPRTLGVTIEVWSHSPSAWSHFSIIIVTMVTLDWYGKVLVGNAR